MERAIDKFILYIGTVFGLWLTLSGISLIVAANLTLALSAAELWLLPLKRPNSDENELRIRRIIAEIILTAAAVLTLLRPELMGVLPLILYDLILCRCWPGIGIAGLSMLSAVYLSATGRELAASVIWLTAGMSFLSLWMCRKSLLLREHELQIRKLRDDAEERNQILQNQNEQLLEARDSEVVTAQLSERNRIAREIHDNVGHTLSRALLQVGALLAIHKEEPVHSELEGVRGTLDQAMNSIRSSVHDLHDSSVDLESTLKQIAEPLKEGFRVSLDLDISGDTPREIKYSMIGIVRECVSNILRHSRNDTVQISILEHPGFYRLVVHDFLSEGGEEKGQPMTGKENGTPGIGLTNIENRARALKGNVQISTERGYRVFVTIPKS